jgi:hypothetical protein
VHLHKKKFIRWTSKKFQRRLDIYKKKFLTHYYYNQKLHSQHASLLHLLTHFSSSDLNCSIDVEHHYVNSLTPELLKVISFQRWFQMNCLRRIRSRKNSPKSGSSSTLKSCWWALRTRLRQL